MVVAVESTIIVGSAAEIVAVTVNIYRKLKDAFFLLLSRRHFLFKCDSGRITIIWVCLFSKILLQKQISGHFD